MFVKVCQCSSSSRFGAIFDVFDSGIILQCNCTNSSLSLSLSLTHSLTHSRIHSLIHSLTHSLSYSLNECHTHSYIHSVTHRAFAGCRPVHFHSSYQCDHPLLSDSSCEAAAATPSMHQLCTYPCCCCCCCRLYT